MRRWFTLLLLVLMPLQSVWAAASAYCLHEQGRSAQHLGHHAHDHQGAAGDAHAQHQHDGQAGYDSDCGSCHLGGATLLAPAAALPSTLPAADVHAASTARFRSIDPVPIDRPNWAAALV